MMDAQFAAKPVLERAAGTGQLAGQHRVVRAAIVSDARMSGRPGAPRVRRLTRFGV